MSLSLALLNICSKIFEDNSFFSKLAKFLTNTTFIYCTKSFASYFLKSLSISITNAYIHYKHGFRDKNFYSSICISSAYKQYMPPWMHQPCNTPTFLTYQLLNQSKPPIKLSIIEKFPSKVSKEASLYYLKLFHPFQKQKI